MANELFFSEGQQELATATAAVREGTAVIVASSTQERVARAVADLPKETAGYPIDYLMREDFSTGQTIVVDGGAVLV
jgi:NAD(P)-dependent dehydrogenase (short-subunit alcohol dehydrogenase family)